MVGRLVGIPERRFPKPDSAICWLSVLNPCGAFSTGVSVCINLGVRLGVKSIGLEDRLSNIGQNHSVIEADSYLQIKTTYQIVGQHSGAETKGL